jgi:serine/threonine protein kinase
MLEIPPSYNSWVFHASHDVYPGKWVFKFIRPVWAEGRGCTAEQIEGEKLANKTFDRCPYVVTGRGFWTSPRGTTYGYFMRALDTDCTEFAKRDYISHPIIAKITYRVLLALDYMHKAGWAHCDVKPENILLDLGGQCDAYHISVTLARLACSGMNTIRTILS